MATFTPTPAHPTAAAVYGNPTGPVALRIGTGGAGESGVLQALAEEFLMSVMFPQKEDSQEENSAIEWYTTHTSDSFDYLQNGVVDVVITYHAAAELTAMNIGIAERAEYAWRDHWMLVGPKANPAQLSTDGESTIYGLFTKLMCAMEAAKKTPTPIKFLSRYDGSANNIKESNIWSTIGQTPWVEKRSSWYHMSKSFPSQALREAAELGEYTLTDRGTWCAIGPDIRDKLTVFTQGSGLETDPLLNPAHLLVGNIAKNKEIANLFADWMTWDSGGQQVIRDFMKDGMTLYEPAPRDVDPLGLAKALMYPSLTF